MRRGAAQGNVAAMQSGTPSAVNPIAPSALLSSVLAAILGGFRAGFRTTEFWLSLFAAVSPFVLTLADKLPGQWAVIVSAFVGLVYHNLRNAAKNTNGNRVVAALDTIAEHSADLVIAPPAGSILSELEKLRAVQTQEMRPLDGRNGFARVPLLASLLGCFAVIFCGCASLKSAYGTAEARKATGRALLADAVSILGKIAVSELGTLATSQLDPDSAHSAAAAAWSAVNVSDIGNLINDATGRAAPVLAAKAATLAQRAMNTGVSSADARDAVASAISAAALGVK